MQQIKLYKEPSLHVFSQNPIVFGFRVTPFTIVNQVNRQRIVYSIQFASNADGVSAKTVFTGMVYPDVNGLCVIDIKSIIDSQLVYFVPNHLIEKVYKCEGQCGWFTLTYFLQEGTALLSSQITTSKYFAYKGGIAKKDIDKNNTYLNDIIYTNQQPLNYFVDKEFIRKDQFRWIFFINKNNNIIDFNSNILMYENEAPDIITYASSISSQKQTSVQHQLYCMPLNVMAESIQDAVDTSFSLVWKLIINLCNSDGSSFYLQDTTFYIDHRNFYDTKCIFYRTSTGALESIVLLGEKEFSSSIQKNSVEVVEAASEIGDYKLQSEMVDVFNKHKSVARVSTGFISKQELMRLVDLLINRQNFQIYGNRLIPVYCLTNSVALYKSSDNLYNLTFDMAIADDDLNFSPDHIISFSSVCPVIDYIDVTQEISEYLYISYKLPSGHKKIHVEASFTYVIAGITYNFSQEWIFNKNMDTVPVLPSLPIPAGQNPTITVTLKGRCVCNDEVEPYSYGPWSANVVYSYKKYKSPEAIDDVADISPRNTDMRVLKKNNVPLNILENDVPANFPLPDFHSFVTAAGVATATSQNGAAIVYNGSGEIEYTPSLLSAANLAADFIFYKCKETVGGIGTLVSNIARITVPLNDEIPVVFVKTVALNQVETQHKYGFLNTAVASSWKADIYLQFFLDAACTIPVDVTGLGINVEYTINSNYEQYNNFGSLIASGGPTFLLTNTVTATGFSMLLYPNYDWVTWNSGTQTETFFHFTWGLGSNNYIGLLPTW